MDENAFLHRIDTAHPGRFHLTLMLLTGSCWAWAAYGVTIIGFLLPALQAEWNITAASLGFLASMSMLGMTVGAVLAGSLADRFGRRRVLTLNMVYLGLLSILSALAPNYTVLLGLRFLAGMGLGAILPVAGTLVGEFSPARQRGTLMVLLNGFWGVGGTLAALVGYSLVLSTGWRPAMLFGGLSILSGLLVHRVLPESLRFLLNKGEHERVRKEFTRVRLAPIAGAPSPAVTDALDAAQPQPPAGNHDGLWSQRYAYLTFSLWFLWMALNFLYQGVFIWLPSLLAGVNNSTSHAFLLTLFISLGQIPGTLVVAYLADRGSRRQWIIFSLTLLGASALLFSLSGSTAWMLTMGFFMMVFNGMVCGLAHPFAAELYPTRMRGTATGWATGVGRLGGVAAPLLIAWVIQAGGGMRVIFSILGSAPLFSMLILTGLKQETTGRSLEEISGG